ncbi:MAG: hypothetical protein U5K55_01860 [Aliarcobacter sp.]|nr:hypothetical protein [Aliarcobacter sp.]
MGTLYTQELRMTYDLDMEQCNEFFDDVQTLTKSHKMTNQEIIEGLKVLELRRKNDLFVNNGDIYDEQIAGIGKELSKISSSLKEITEEINRRG